MVIIARNMKVSDRKAVKAGKHERIKTLLNNLGATQPQPVVKDQPTLAEVLDCPGIDRRSTGKETAF